jgi:nitroreductase
MTLSKFSVERIAVRQFSLKLSEASRHDCVAMMLEVLRERRTVLPKRLMSPGPSPQELQLLLEAASTAPDHAQIVPWRFISFPESSRPALGELFANALIERDPDASEEQMNQARAKADRAPLLLLLVVDEAKGDCKVDLNERLISAGCAVQNVLSCATAMGFGSAVTSGKALKSDSFRKGLGLIHQTYAICFVSVGSFNCTQPNKVRPIADDFFSTWIPNS